MAKYDSLAALFSAIANAIRAKDGGANTIVAEDFPTAIMSIPVSVEGLKFTDFSNFFRSGARLEQLDYIDTSVCTDFTAMFLDCSQALTSIPELDTSNGTDFSSMFYNCSALTSIPELDTSNGTDFTAMFYNCKALTNLYLYNIRAPISIGSGTSWGYKLTVESLVHTIQELCIAGATKKTLTMGSANLEKIAGLYCKIIDDTVEKKTMELCESTDEGAMTLTDYAAEKGWSLA